MAKQLLIDFYNCNRKSLYDIDFLRSVAREVVVVIDAKIVEETYHQFEPFGITYVAIISKSHISFHTWPEFGTVAVDLFTCDDSLPETLVSFLQEKFSASDYQMKTISRELKI